MTNSSEMKKNRGCRRIAVKARAKIQTTLRLWCNDTCKEEASKKPALTLSSLAKASSIKKIARPSKNAVKSTYHPMETIDDKHSPLNHLRNREAEEKMIRHEAYEKRRAARMVHSSKKLYLSNRLASIIKHSSPQSPIESISFASYFSDSESGLIRISGSAVKAQYSLHSK
jgi:hypothetical protein